MKEFQLVNKTDLSSLRKEIKFPKEGIEDLSRINQPVENSNKNNINQQKATNFQKRNSGNSFLYDQLDIVTNVNFPAQKKNPFENQLEKYEEKYLEIKNSKVYNTLNRILFSENCIYYYMISIIISVLILIYSTLCFFAIELSKRKIFN